MEIRVSTFVVLPALAVLLQGCVTDAIRTVDMYNNARSGYQAYQGFSGMKDFEKAKPVLKDSDTLYVVADLKPAKDAPALNSAASERICTAFAREFESMAKHGINRGRHLSCMASGDVPPTAVVLNLREQVEEKVGLRLLQSDTIKSETSWVARSTGTVLDAQANVAVKSHDDLIDYVSQSLTAQLLRSLAPEQGTPEYEQWGKNVEAWSKERSKG